MAVVGVFVAGEPEEPLVVEDELGAVLDEPVDFGVVLCVECGELFGCPASGSTYC